ncbi:MAG: hypothetical protein IAG13_31955 [Deltaproteobacteria bacterium]|nr:hypothetical protein [Nannocystaceae bacterium]
MPWLLRLFASMLTSTQPHDSPEVRVRSVGECLSVEALVARVQGWGGRADWPREVEVEVEHEPTSLRIRVVPRTGPAVERVFERVPAACQDVELMAAVAIAMALDVADQQDAIASVPERPPQPASAPTSTPAAPPAARARARAQLSLALGGGAAVGVTPFATGEAMTGVHIRWSRVAVFGELELGARGIARIGGDAGTLSVVRFAPVLGFCSPWDRGRWSVGLCAAAAVGPLVARTRNTLAPRTGVALWVAAIARTEVAVKLSPRWSLVGRSDLVIGLLRPSIVATREPSGQASAWHTPRLGWRGLLAARIRLGRIDASTVKRGPAARIEGER